MKIKAILILLAILTESAIQAQEPVINTSYVTGSGEKVLQLSITVPLRMSETWDLFTTQKGLEQWIAPVVKVKLKTGGYIITNYDKTKSAEDSSSIRLDIINYLENKLITLKVNLTNAFPEKVRKEDKNLQEILQFADAGEGKTKIISSMVGWGTGPEWDKVYAFFEKGNDWTYREILKLFNEP